ncbi:N-acetyltransferase family protein [Flavitalea flava]
MNEYLTKDGRAFIIRRPNENDAEDIINYSKNLFASTDQVLTTLEEYTISVGDEKTWINKANQHPDALTLIAVNNDQILGLLFFSPGNKKKNSHAGEFGVSVHPDFQGLGIGLSLLERLLKWAKDNKNIEKVFLNVFDTNEKAIRLYKALGFKEEGRHIKAIKQISGEYADVLQFYIDTK